jgi:DNA repair protein RadC
VIDEVKISAGGLAGTVVDVRCILREALLKRASAIVLCHNHPSGSIRPSREDDMLTRQVEQASQCMNIRFVDHVILTDGAFYSYADEGRI